MDKKYILTDATKEVNGHIVHRIARLRPDGSILYHGGWIESEDNLSQNGTCFVYGDSVVCGDAYIYGNVQMILNSYVDGNVIISGMAYIENAVIINKTPRPANIGGYSEITSGAHISGPVRITGYARIFTDFGPEDRYFVQGPIGSRGDYTTFIRSKGEIYATTGCFRGTLEEFRAAVRATHCGSKHEAEYLAAARAAAKVLKVKKKEVE